jgi:hypothetical protein
MASWLRRNLQMKQIEDVVLKRFYEDRKELVYGWTIIIGLASLGLGSEVITSWALFGLIVPILLWLMLAEFRYRLIRRGVTGMRRYERFFFERWLKKNGGQMVPRISPE